ncbi:MAG: hypothetical protein RLZZ241_1746 [Bacteroidota bacterium]|jgi:xylulokinase
MYWIGYDIGSSSVKAALVDSKDGREIGRVQAPKQEMPIAAPEPGWGEQDPEMWWKYTREATAELLQQTGATPRQIRGIGISYQMHGLVAVDSALKVVRPSIIWCDSRAVSTGAALLNLVGTPKCREHLLNAPGNFTLSKLLWVKQQEPELFNRIHKIMLPGDYIAMRMSGNCTTTASGLSEGMLWDFKSETPAWWLLEASGIQSSLLPELVPTFGPQVTLNGAGALQLGLPEDIPVLYRAGDQPNNALSLNVMQPGEVAATGGTSGVVYAVTSSKVTGEMSRINNFAHVNHTQNTPRIGKLLCINGTGIQYSWMQQNVSPNLEYSDMNAMGAKIPIGSEGLRVFPFGNGAERMLNNLNPGARISGLNFNAHKQAHLYRAALEGIAFSFVYGMEILKSDGVPLQKIRAGNDNLFRAKVFSETIATLTGSSIEMVTTTGAAGAARAAATAAGVFTSLTEATATDQVQLQYDPLADSSQHQEAYQAWKHELTEQLKPQQP